MRTPVRTLPRTLVALLLAIVAVSVGSAGTAVASAAVTSPAGAARAATIPRVAGFMNWTPGTVTATYNSTGQGVMFERRNAGLYNVIFAGIQTPHNAQISVPGHMPDNATCSVQAMVPTTVGVQVQVNCFNSAGMLADEPFDLLITNSRSPRAGVFDFAEFNRDGALVQALSFNSAGKQNSAVRTGIGVYGVTMPGSGSAGSARGTVKVSAASDVAVSCQIGAWSATKTAQKITVRCFSPSGTPQDTPFFVSYARGTNLMGRDGLIDANASVLGHESHPVYQPAVQFDSTRNARITVAHTDPGSYLVFFAGSGPTAQANGGAGNIQVTPIGAQYRRCGYTLLRKTVPELQVTCADAAGHPRNTPFTVQWVVNP